MPRLSECLSDATTRKNRLVIPARAPSRPSSTSSCRPSVGLLQIVLVDVGGDAATEIVAGLLIEPEMNAAVNPRVVDVIADLVERLVMERQVCDRRVQRIGHGDRVAAFAVETAEDLGGAVAPARVVRRVAREAGRRDVGQVVGVRIIDLLVAVIAREADGILRTPEVVVILGGERRDQTVARRHVEERQRAGVLG